MRLTWKLTLAITCVILAVMAVNAWIRIDREIALFEHDIRRDHRTLGRALAGAVARTAQMGSESAVFEIIQDANAREREIAISWVWLDETALLSADHHRLLNEGREVATVRSVGVDAEADEIVTYVPVAGPRPGAIELRESLAEEHAYVRKTVFWACLYAAVLISLCGAAVMTFGALLVGRPVRVLTDHARRIAAGELSARLHLPQRDELGELASEMNTMAGHLELARQQVELATAAHLAAVEQMRHAERLMTVGKLAAGIAHEVGTPLNVVLGHAQLITEEHPAESSAFQNAKIIVGQVQRVTAIINQLLDFARRRAPARTVQDLGPLVRQVASLLASLAQKRGVEITLALPPGALCALVDVGQIQQVITNLVINAIDASPAGGTVTVGVECRELRPPPDHGGPLAVYLRLFVRDHGSGIAPGVLERIFEPFFTTKDTGQGTGLGLAVVYGIVKEHRGWIDVETSVGKGSCFSVLLALESAP